MPSRPSYTVNPPAPISLARLIAACEAVRDARRPPPYRVGEGAQFFAEIPLSVLTELSEALEALKEEG